MSLRDQLSSLAAIGVSMRTEAYGVPCVYEGHEFQGSPSTERDNRKLRDGGLIAEYDRKVRFLKSAIPVKPRSETSIRVDGKKYRISEVRDVLMTTEWVLTLVQMS